MLRRPGGRAPYRCAVKSIVNTATPRDRLLCAVHGRDAIGRRQRRLHEPHVAPLTDWVETVRQRLDVCHAATVADFDPLGGGISARVMYLAQDPSSTAAETGFISPDNNDATARATTSEAAGTMTSSRARMGARVRRRCRLLPADESRVRSAVSDHRRSRSPRHHRLSRPAQYAPISALSRTTRSNVGRSVGNSPARMSFVASPICCTS